MKSLTDTVKNIQDIWKELTLIGTWIGAIAASFLLPLPDWDSVEQHISKMRFIFFMATVVSGFILLLTYKYKNKNIWIWISVVTFFFFICSFYMYDSQRENNTLPYYGSRKVIGNIPLDDFEETLKDLGKSKDDQDLLEYVQGDASKLWTRSSINNNRNSLILYLALAYCLLAIFLMSFMNALILNIKK